MDGETSLGFVGVGAMGRQVNLFRFLLGEDYGIVYADTSGVTGILERRHTTPSTTGTNPLL